MIMLHNRWLKRHCIGLSLLFIASSPMRAQAPITPARCDALLERIAVGSASRTEFQEMVRSVECSSAARRALGVGFERLRTSRDRDQLVSYMYAMRRVPEPEHLDAAMRVADDEKASLEARVVALMYLYQLMQPYAAPSYDGFTAGFDSQGLPRGSCSAHKSTSRYVESTESLPPDWHDAARRLADRIYRDPGLGEQLRGAALCVR